MGFSESLKDVFHNYSFELYSEFKCGFEKLMYVVFFSCLEYYSTCEIQFMNLDNIHAIRKAFIQLRQHCSTASDQLK